jgi:hypothetical protein
MLAARRSPPPNALPPNGLLAAGAPNPGEAPNSDPVAVLATDVSSGHAVVCLAALKEDTCRDLHPHLLMKPLRQSPGQKRCLQNWQPQTLKRQPGPVTRQRAQPLHCWLPRTEKRQKMAG